MTARCTMPGPSRSVACACRPIPIEMTIARSQLLHAAFDAGVTLLDTADAYCLDERDIGHNERLIARALSTWSGDRSRITDRHQRRHDPARRPLGTGWTGEASAGGVRTQLSCAGRRSHRALSTARARSAHAAVDERQGPRGVATRRPDRRHRPVATSPSVRSKRRDESRRSPPFRSSSASGTMPRS